MERRNAWNVVIAQEQHLSNFNPDNFKKLSPVKVEVKVVGMSKQKILSH